MSEAIAHPVGQVVEQRLLIEFAQERDVFIDAEPVSDAALSGGDAGEPGPPQLGGRALDGRQVA